VFTGARYTLPYLQPLNIDRVHGRSKDALLTRVHGPCGAWNTLPVFTARKRGPCLKAAFTGRVHMQCVSSLKPWFHVKIKLF